MDWDARIQLALLPPDAGGRRRPLTSGYRSLMRLEGSHRDFGVQVELEDDQLAPGNAGVAYVAWWADDAPLMARGARFELREGARVVGHGVVLETR